MDPILGQIILFAGNFAPRGWALCDGQLLAISQNSALFSILGTTYGGDGVTTFALPDLRGRVPLHPGTGPGLSHHGLGEQGGSETSTLSLNNLPPHGHSIGTTSGGGSGPRMPGRAIGDRTLAPADGGTAKIATSSVGEGQPVQNMQPYLGLNYIIAMEGIYPSRG